MSLSVGVFLLLDLFGIRRCVIPFIRIGVWRFMVYAELVGRKGRLILKC
jgi:hypothetical protein